MASRATPPRAAAPDPAPGPVGGACVEEVGEPDDSAGQAAPLGGVEIAGGLCNAAPDFYRIDAAGAWRVDLRFSHADGDLDLYLWDTARGDVAVAPDGRPLGSDSTTTTRPWTASAPRP